MEIYRRREAKSISPLRAPASIDLNLPGDPGFFSLEGAVGGIESNGIEIPTASEVSSEKKLNSGEKNSNEKEKDVEEEKISQDNDIEIFAAKSVLDTSAENCFMMSHLDRSELPIDPEERQLIRFLDASANPTRNPINKSSRGKKVFY
jgi:hypothetical protein